MTVHYGNAAEQTHTPPQCQLQFASQGKGNELFPLLTASQILAILSHIQSNLIVQKRWNGPFGKFLQDSMTKEKTKLLWLFPQQQQQKNFSFTRADKISLSFNQYTAEPQEFPITLSWQDKSWNYTAVTACKSTFMMSWVRLRVFSYMAFAVLCIASHYVLHTSSWLALWCLMNSVSN